jgi:hypothetical protein
LGAGDGVALLENKARHAGDPHLVRSFVFLAHEVDPLLTVEKAAHIRLVHTGVGARCGEHVAVADVLGQLEIAVKQPVYDGVLSVLQTGQGDEAM